MNQQRPSKPSCWICPHCKAPLKASLIEQSERTNALRCANNHAYDYASQGYVNLVLANQKNSKTPGDSAQMLSARREFFSLGFYDSLFNTVAEKAANLAAKVEGHGRLLDIGCGEGSYLAHISKVINAKTKAELDLCGIDISKFAAKKAAPLVPCASIAVASSYDIPLPNNAVDLALSVFAPVSAAEILRVLKPSGYLIRVSPGAKHLLQIKQAIYKTATQHADAEVLDGFRPAEKVSIGFIKSLKGDELARLLAMTPLNWRGDEAAKQSLSRQHAFEVDFDFNLEVLRPNISDVATEKEQD